MDAHTFVQILSDPEVEKRFYEIFKSLIKLTINELVKPIKQKLDIQLIEFVATITQLKAEIASCSNLVYEL